MTIDIAQRIDAHMNLLKKLGFDVVTTDEYEELLEQDYLNEWVKSWSSIKPSIKKRHWIVYTHNIQYPPHLNTNSCILWFMEGCYEFTVSIDSKSIPEEVTKKLLLLGYSDRNTMLKYGEGDVCNTGSTE